MSGCTVLSLAYKVQHPAMFLRPESEMTFGTVAADMNAFADMRHETYVASPGVHGSSMLVTERVKGDTNPTWRAVISFLNQP